MRQIRPLRTDVRTRKTPRKRRVLAVVGDTQVGLWVVRSLGRAGLEVFAVCASEKGLSAFSRYASGAWVIEAGPDDPAFVDEIHALARQLDAASVLTIAESYHQALLRSRDRFEPDIHVFSPPAKAFEKATDKDFMHALALDLGVPVACGTTLDKLMAASDGGPLRFPLVLRTRQYNAALGAAPWKAAYAENPQQLQALYRDVQTLASNVLVQEYHPGVEDHIQVLVHRGEAFMVGEYLGEHHMPPAGGVTVQRVTCHHEDLARDAVRLLQAIGWEGVAGVQFHYDPDTGKYIFLEINPRFIGGLPTVIMAGFDAPFLLWQSHFEPDRMKRGHYRLGLRTRIAGGDANWLLGMLRGDPLPPGQKRLGKASAIARFLWNCGPWTRDDTFCLTDPKPAWVDLWQMIRRLGERSVDLIGGPRPPEKSA
jgi:predicted ATP-grasp superfamily ATP-dependent carboligase